MVLIIIKLYFKRSSYSGPLISLLQSTDRRCSVLSSAEVLGGGDKDYIIVCFDVRSEKFRCVKDTDGYTQPFRSAPLVNFNGKLASLGPEETVDGSCGSIRLRVLEDVEKGEWSEQRHSCCLRCGRVWLDVLT